MRPHFAYEINSSEYIENIFQMLLIRIKSTFTYVH